MASKTLVRTGASLINRFLNPSLRQNSIPKPLLHGFVNPSISSSISRSSPHLQEYDNETLKTAAFDGFSFPCGIPSLRFFIQNGDFLLSSSPFLFLFLLNFCDNDWVCKYANEFSRDYFVSVPMLSILLFWSRVLVNMEFLVVFAKTQMGISYLWCSAGYLYPEH